VRETLDLMRAAVEKADAISQEHSDDSLSAVLGRYGIEDVQPIQDWARGEAIHTLVTGVTSGELATRLQATILVGLALGMALREEIEAERV
jgi:hypothetical protein